MRILKSKITLALAGLLATLIALTLLFPTQAAETGIALERANAGLELKTLQVSGIEVAYLEGGKGEPLLLIHGFGSNKDNWTRVSGYLTPQFHVYAIDLPGFGDSSKPADWRYRIQDQVEYVHTIAQALGLQRVHLGGSSMGGQIAASYAARYPNEVASLWLNAPAGVASAEPSEMFKQIALMKPGDRMPLLSQTPEDFPQVFDMMFVDPPFVPGFVVRYLGERAAANFKLHERIFEEIRSESIPLENLMGGLQTPARIVWGEQDRVLHASGAKILAGLMPNASVLLLPDTGHLPMMERTQVVAEDYLSFRAALK